MPFFPMRPVHGPAIKSAADLHNLDPKYHWQLKLNGDRACLAVVDHKVHVQNRHGDWFKQSTNPFDLYASLSGTWLFDGEVYQKNFYPFEVLVKAGETLANQCPSIRAAAAKSFCAEHGLRWWFDLDSLADAEATRLIAARDGAVIEGVVGKRLGTRYIPMGSATSETFGVVKRKWC